GGGGGGGGGGGNRRLAGAVAIGSAIAAATVLALLWPFDGERSGGVLERALAAVGQGRVVHVTFRTDPGFTLVNLETGARRRLFTEREVWYDEERGLHELRRIGDTVVEDSLWAPGEVPDLWRRTFAVMADGYRESVASGRADLLGAGEVDDRPVYWVRVDERSLPAISAATGREWAFDVAVAQDTYLPVATRIVGNGAPTSPPMLERISHVEMLGEGGGSFAPGDVRPRMAEGACCKGGGRATVREAAELLGRPPLGLGDSFLGRPFGYMQTTEGWIRWEGSAKRALVTFVHVFYGQLDAAGKPHYERGRTSASTNRFTSCLHWPGRRSTSPLPAPPSSRRKGCLCTSTPVRTGSRY
ncbi:MAG: hypothetical protein ABR583_11435, partial [Gaiellaceae bacterium]